MKIATAAIIKRKDKFLIAKRKAGGIVGGKWEFPGGKKEQCESLKECLERELKEELGIRVKVGKMIDERIHRYKTGTIRVFVYKIDHFEGEFELNEHDEIRWVKASQMQKFSFIGNDKPIVKKLSHC